ncbi:MAG: ABC transporter ATP-binding protein [Betaproteobacteria bacterium]
MKRNFSWIKDLAGVAAWFPGLSFAAAALTIAAALLEGAGLAALVPLVSSLVAGDAAQLPWLPFSLPAEPDRAIKVTIAIFIALAAAASLSRFLAELLQLRLRAAIEKRARDSLTQALLSMAWPAYIAVKQGDLAQAQFTEGIQIGTGAQMLVQATGAALASIAYLAVALTISPQMTAYTIAFGVMVAGLYITMGRRGQRHADRLSGLATEIGRQLNELFGALKFARSTGLTRQAEADANMLYEKWRTSYVASQAYAFALRHGFELLGLAFIAIFLLASASRGAAGLATGLVFLGVFYRLAPRLLAVQDGLFQARTSHGWYVSWSSRLAYATSSSERFTGTLEPELNHSLELRNVSYRYPGTTDSTLKHVQLQVAKGELVAIVGPSGAGKTTLLDLVTGLLSPTSGVVLIDSVDLSRLDMDKWRSRIGFVPQDPLLVNGDLTENICWGATRADGTRAEQAAKRAGLQELIRTLPQGMATPIGERGARLSGGQRQRLALARALYRDPAILILDEPTSSLDRDSEQQVLDAISSIRGTCTTVVVTHSDSVAKVCDRVYQLRQGALNSLDASRPGVAHAG